MKNKFKVGDKVRVKVFDKRPIPWNMDGKMDHLMGQVVKITDVYGDTLSIFDETYHRDWLLHECHVELIKNECIVIYRKGAEVIALDKRTGERAIAKCSPSDEFDFNVGAKLAFDRLTHVAPVEPKKPKFYSGKIIFTKGDEIFKTGHIYEIKDGRIVAPDGRLLPSDARGPLVDIDDVRCYFTSAIKRRKNPGWSNETLKLIEVEDD